MTSLTPIPYKFSVLKKYIYNINGTTTSGCENLHNNLGFIKNRIQEYKQNRIKFSPLLPMPFVPFILQDKLYSIYDSDSDNIKDLKSQIRSINKTVCAYCGTQDSPYQIDHFLPRSVFQEFSILTYNLIPSCATCNSRYKGDDYISDKGLRLFYNPYFDTFINSVQFLKCTISCTNDYLNINFNIDTSQRGIYGNEIKILQSHFEILHLNERYINLIIDEIFPEFYNEFVEENIMGASFINVTLQDLTDVINRRIRGLRGHNQNFWKKVFWEELKVSTSCLNLIIHKKIPLS